MTQPKIRIAFVIDQLNIGGTEKQLVDLICHLDKNRFEIFLYCLRSSSYFSHIELPCTKKVLGVPSLLSRNGLRKLYKFSQELRYRKIDIIQGFFFDSTLFGVIAAKLAGRVKIIASKRDLGYWYTPRLLKILRLLSKFIDAYLVNSIAVKNTVAGEERVPADKIEVIYNGIDPPIQQSDFEKAALKAKLGIRENEAIVGIVANLNRPVKRLDLFILAAERILRKMSNVAFIIVGDGHLRRSLEQSAKKIGISKHIHFVGSVNNPHAYIAIFDIAVLTSDSEGFSNSVIEYMAHGLPVVASNIGGNTEIIKSNCNGLLFQPGDTAQLSEQIVSLLENPGMRELMGNNARSVCINFFWETNILNYQNFYDNISP